MDTPTELPARCIGYAGTVAKMAVNGLGGNTLSAVPTSRMYGEPHFLQLGRRPYAGGLIGGYSTAWALLPPDNTITRLQAMSILGRYLSNWDRHHGVIHGDGTIMELELCSR
jgi:hypothetical protein